MLRAILAGIVEAQHQGGIQRTLNIKGKAHRVTLKVPISIVIGDCEGNDKLCGRYGTHQKGNALVCRDCDCPTSLSDVCNISCQPLTTALISNIRHNPEALKAHSHHGIDNAFHELDFGGDEEGIHGCTPPEMLHLYQQGLYKYALKAFINYLTSEQRHALDQLIISLSDSCCRQSDRSFPRFRFPRGISNLSCFTAAEQVGVTILCFFAMIMDDFRSIMVKYNRRTKTYDTNEESLRQCVEFRKLFEAMLITEYWINQESHTHDEVMNQAPGRITHFMSFYKKTIDRVVGNGLKIPKFHQLKHLPRYILKFGVPNNFSTARCESHHIVLSKRPAKTAQKRDESFEKQVGDRIIDSIVLSKATSSILSITTVPEINRNNPISGTKFTVIKLQDSLDYVAVQKNSPYNILPFPSLLINNFGRAFSQYFSPHDGIPCFTEHHRCDEHNTKYIFRGHPLYRGKAWHDWAYFSWYDGDNSNSTDGERINGNQHDTLEIPGRIYFFLDATNMVTEHPEYEPGLYAIIESLDKTPTSVPGSKIVKRSSISRPGRFHVCHTDTIVSVAFVIPNIGFENEYYIIDPPSDWPAYFLA